MSGSEGYGRLKNYIGGMWKESESEKNGEIYDPGSGRVLGTVPYSTLSEVDEAVAAAQQAFGKWSRLPLPERVQYLFRLRQMFERHFEDLARINTLNHGKTLEESRGDIRRAIENIDMAISAAHTLAKGEVLDRVADGIDEYMVREPLGVFAIVSPFNFPIMIPFWFIPYALVLGNTVVVKPSEITPLPMNYVAELMEKEVKLPAGVLNIIHGGRETVEGLIKHRDVVGVSFVGSTAAARNVYRLAGEHGKRVIAQGGAKNSIVVMPDANLGYMPSIISSFFGNTGQRCLAGSNLLVVGQNGERVKRHFTEAAARLRVGHGLEPGTDMGPLVLETARRRVRMYVEKGLDEGAELILDGRETTVENYPYGFYLGPTILDNVTPDMEVAKTEIFGPVASIIEASNLDEAIDIINRGTDYGNMACIYTSSGAIADRFRKEVNVGNVGVNIGVAAPAAYFPFGGRKSSFFGTLHAQADTINFFTDRKIVVQRW
jgi:malonate-semialdehyde dehydrogenase (acetylating)/methylmalonate-semialdehyde dehydrogenase